MVSVWVSVRDSGTNKKPTVFSRWVLDDRLWMCFTKSSHRSGLRPRQQTRVSWSECSETVVLLDWYAGRSSNGAPRNPSLMRSQGPALQILREAFEYFPAF